MKRSKSGQFLATPEGKKTPRMLEVERALGRTLEKDFEEYYWKRGWGQKRLATRWGVPRGLIFSKSLRGKRRCWVQMLGLKTKKTSSDAVVPSSSKKKCEACEQQFAHLEGAHWISKRDGGHARSSNILKLCPNCHTLLDRDDKKTTAYALSALLYREASKIVMDSKNEPRQRAKNLVIICTQIIRRQL